MKRQYYLVSQLPEIRGADKKALPITVKSYKELCSRFLTPGEYKNIAFLNIEAPREENKTGSEFLDKWYSYDRGLRTALATERAARLKKEAKLNTSGITQDIVQTARTACNMDSPLESETYLYNARLATLDAITPLDYFSQDYVLAYGVRLMLLERAAKFDKIRGQESYKEIYADILNGANDKSDK